MLVIFDVDGTLTATTAVDAEAYARTFRAVFGVPLPTTDWATYEHATDHGIADECVRRLGLDPARVPELEREFVSELRRVLSESGARAIPGAAAVLGWLNEAAHAIAIATGAWEEAARAKLAAAGIAVGDCVLVGSDANTAREEIVREAVRRSATAVRTVYVGDGAWDVQAARRLRLPFVGIDPSGAGALHREGVREVVRDYRDLGGFMRALEQAVVP